MRGLLIKQPYASRIVRKEMPIIFLPSRAAKERFINKFIKRGTKLLILATMVPDKQVDKENYPLGKAVGTVEIDKVVVALKTDVFSGKISGVGPEYIQKYPWNVSKLGDKISMWFFKNIEEQDPCVSYAKVPGAQRWIKNVKLER